MLFYPSRSDALFSNYFEEDLLTYKWLLYYLLAITFQTLFSAIVVHNLFLIFYENVPISLCVILLTNQTTNCGQNQKLAQNGEGYEHGL